MKNYRFIKHEQTYPNSFDEDNRYNLLKIFNIEPDKDPIRLTGPGGEAFVFHKVAATTKGRYTLVELTFRPGPGPFPHIHHFEDEWVYIAEGNVQFSCGNTMHSAINDIPGTTSPQDVLHTMTAGPGTLVYLPRYMVHTFSNPGLTQVRMYAVWAAGGTENFFKAEVSKTPLEMTEIGPKYGVVMSSDRDQFVKEYVTGGSFWTNNQLDRFVELLNPSSSGIETWKREENVFSHVGDVS
jgi:mannose-6-phosphate isomerase-like protein (cupin superfamily)